MKKALLLILCLALLLPGLARAGGIPPESAPGQRGQAVLALEEALLQAGYYEGPAAGVYTRALASAVMAFQKDRGLAPSGQADRDTLLLLFKRPAPGPGDTQMPPWYGGGSHLIPRGARFQVKDVRTGIIFSCQRMMGVSHLDAEPLTETDTRLMKEAYGGTWSWDRRPILVKYRDQVYAASMNGMPHGDNTIPANGMRGHFCIHFAFSRGDSTQRVDVDHLNAAFEASFASWEEGDE